MRTWRSDRGASTTELVLVTPIIIALLLMVALAGRVTMARSDVVSASRDAARAASLQRTSTAARTEGIAAGMASLTERGVECRNPDIRIDVADFRAGGTVTAEVICAIGLSDLALLAVPGEMTASGRAVEVVDVYRGLGE